MLNHKLTVVFLIFLAVASFPVCHTTSEQLTVDDLDSQGFQKKIISIFQHYTNNNLRCKTEVGKYTYYSYTGRCESCADLCSVETDAAALECHKNCQVYLNDVEHNETIALLNERLKSVETVSSISIFMAALLFVLMILIIVYLIRSMMNMETRINKKLRGRPQTEERLELRNNRVDDLPHPAQETRAFVETNEDNESAYASQRSVDRNSRS